jgi:F-type H+-transporting ATPase subunit epsilon
MAETLPNELQLSIVSPDHLVVRDSVSAVTVPGKNGYIGVLPGHAPLLTELVPGELSYTREGAKRYLSVNWGFAEVLPGRVIVLVQSAERAEEIDIERAGKAKQRAEDRLKRFSDPEIDMERAREALRRAISRLEVASHIHS